MNKIYKILVIIINSKMKINLLNKNNELKNIKILLNYNKKIQILINFYNFIIH